MSIGRTCEFSYRYCITRLTLDLIPQVLKEWGKTAVQGVYFEFFTPRRGDDLRLWPDWKSRDRTISQLVELKKTYGYFIANTYQELMLMKSENFRGIVDNCPFYRIGASFDPMGRRKFPCAVGPEADCSRCGCILPAFAQILSRRHLMIRALCEGIRRRSGKRSREKTPSQWDSLLFRTAKS